MASPDLQSLRRQLREQFPQAHQPQAAPPSTQLTPRLPAFPSGALSELTPAGPASGLSLILAELLQGDHVCPLNTEHCTLPKEPLALIDGRDSFDPVSYGPDACSRLLWVRCHTADESLRCTDLLLRDGNLPLLVLDLQLNSLEELRKIPTSSWYRLRNLARQSGAALLIFTPKHLVPCAALQLTFDTTFSLTDLERAREDLSMTRSRELQTTAKLS